MYAFLQMLNFSSLFLNPLICSWNKIISEMGRFWNAREECPLDMHGLGGATSEDSVPSHCIRTERALSHSEDTRRNFMSNSLCLCLSFPLRVSSGLNARY
jgi:hypothetical protein